MPLKAGVVQFSPLYGRVVENLDRLEGWVEEGASRGVQLLVLPELAWTGYLWANAASLRPFAEPAGAGLGQDRVAAWARRWNLWLSYGFAEAAGEVLYNSQGLASPDGRLHPVYRKTHLFEADTWWAAPGDTGYLQWPSPWGLVGSGICMDMNYPDLIEEHHRRNTGILAFSTNWLDQDEDVVPYWQDRLAGVEDRGFRGLSLFANRGGEEFGVSFRGQSSIFMGGTCLATLPGREDGLLIAEVADEVLALQNK